MKLDTWEDVNTSDNITCDLRKKKYIQMSLKIKYIKWKNT